MRSLPQRFAERFGWNNVFALFQIQFLIWIKNLILFQNMIENTKNLIEDHEPSLSSNVKTKYLGIIENLRKKVSGFVIYLWNNLLTLNHVTEIFLFQFKGFPKLIKKIQMVVKDLFKE